jgi:hypothetical protein
VRHAGAQELLSAANGQGRPSWSPASQSVKISAALLWEVECGIAARTSFPVLRFDFPVKPYSFPVSIPQGISTELPDLLG